MKTINLPFGHEFAEEKSDDFGGCAIYRVYFVSQASMAQVGGWTRYLIERIHCFISHTSFLFLFINIRLQWRFQQPQTFFLIGVLLRKYLLNLNKQNSTCIIRRKWRHLDSTNSSLIIHRYTYPTYQIFPKYMNRQSHLFLFSFVQFWLQEDLR